jgi:hypothetical protein
VGPSYETAGQLKPAITQHFPLLEFREVLTQVGKKSRPPDEIQDDIAKAAAGRKEGSAIFITDVGFSRSYKFTHLARDVNKLNPAAAVALLTTVPECTGEHETMDAYLKKNNMSSMHALLLNYIFSYSAGDHDVIGALLRLHDDKAAFGAGKMKEWTLVLEDTPRYYSNFLGTLYSQGDGKTGIRLARTYEEADAILDALESFGGKAVRAIIDLRFPMGGKMSDIAWEKIFNRVRQNSPDGQVILQSASKQLVEKAQGMAGDRVFVLEKKESIFYHIINIMQGGEG